MARDGKPNGGFPPRLEIANSAIPTFPQVTASVLSLPNQKQKPVQTFCRITCPEHAGRVITMLVLSPVSFGRFWSDRHWPVLT